MKLRKIILGICILLSVSFTSPMAQSFNVSGTVTDKNNVPLVGANVIIKELSIGTAADSEGNFSITNIKNGKYTLEISMMGYQKFIRTISINNSNFHIKIKLKESVIKIDQIVVTAGKHKQRLLELPVSAEVIGSDIISKKNFTKIDDLLRYAPGVNITLDQVSIRGSSGYSRGAGSRVLVAIDGIPVYTGDTGEIIWELVPITDVQRVEIIKGAASSLYGSTAIGGVINIITKSIASKPITFVKSYLGVYDKPSHKEWDWSNKTRTYNGITLGHTNKFGNLGVSISLSRTEDMSYRENDWQNRYSGYLKMQYKFSGKSDLSFFATGFVRDKATFDYWKSSRDALIPPESSIGQVVHSERFLFGSIYNFRYSKFLSFKLKGSLYRSFWKDDSESSNRSSSNLFRLELQSNYQFSNNTYLVSGIEGNMGIVKSNIFGNPTSNVFAIYSQLEYKFNFPLRVSAGIRYDYSRLKNLEAENSLSPKFGLNYKLDTKTYLRASIERGFRAPSLAETFTSTITSGITVKPNPNLKSEHNYSFELGINHSLLSSLNVDAAIFQSDYYNLIEPTIDITDGEVVFENVTRARIQGSEIIIKYSNPGFNFQSSIGYTYLWTKNLLTDKALKYRPRHLVYLKMDYTPGIFSFGVDFRYWSKVEQIDFDLVKLGLVPDGDKRVQVFVLDLRTGINFYSMGIPANLFLNLNNALNYNYVEMIGNISPIRNISLNLQFLF